MTHTIGKDSRSITCHQCNKTSHNLKDVANLYCGHCKKFHGDQVTMNLRAWWELYAAEHIVADENEPGLNEARDMIMSAFYSGMMAFNMAARAHTRAGTLSVESIRRAELDIATTLAELEARQVQRTQGLT
jgi:hypothetical protein